MVAATEVHHITPILTGADDAAMESLAYNKGNLMSLCHACHKAIHERMGKTKSKNKSLIKAAVANFERWLPQKEENNGNIKQDSWLVHDGSSTREW